MQTIPKEVLNQFSDKDLELIASAKDPMAVLPSLSDDALTKIASYKPTKPPSTASDVGVLAQKHLSFGAAPFVAGLGGGAGYALGRFQTSPKSLSERLMELPESFKTGFSGARLEQQLAQAEAEKRSPTADIATGLGSALVTAPLFAVKGAQALSAGQNILKAGKVGAAMGAGQALGQAETPEEAAKFIAGGALTGAAVTGAGEAIKKAAPAIVSGAKKASTKILSTISGISEQDIKTYASRGDKVRELIRKSGGELTEAADQIREKTTKDIQVARQKLNNAISSALDDPKYQGVVVDGAPVLKAIDDQIAKIGGVTAKFRPGEISELKNVRDLIAGTLDPNTGTMPARAMFELKQELQSIASPSYNQGQVIFSRGDLAAKASKGAAAEAKRLLDVALPEIKEANSKLSELHRIEDLINKNLLRSGKPESALIAAGAGGNVRSAGLLERIGKITGTSPLESAQELSAMRTFQNPQLLPIDTTGKSLTRMATLAGLGSFAGPAGAAIGAATTSPLAVKGMIDTASFLQRLGQATGRGVSGLAPSGLGQSLIQTQVVPALSEPKSAAERRLQRLKGAQ